VLGTMVRPTIAAPPLFRNSLLEIFDIIDLFIKGNNILNVNVAI
jgi:hypothetical protein